MRRLVEVWVVDPHPDVPAGESVLVEYQAYITDKTDEEIKLGLDLMGRLDDHNKMRAKREDKRATRASGVTQFLEPARIADISVAIIPLAIFT